MRGLERGRCDARETEPVKPVPEAHVRAVLPFLLPPVQAMVELQLVTGARPGEVRILRACDIDMTGDVWLYRPQTHKTRHRGKERVIAIGPKGQEIIKPFLKLDTQAFLFSPRDAVTHHRAEMRSRRKTRVQPSQADRRKRKPKKQPGAFYPAMSYINAIRKACDKAFPPPEPLRPLVKEDTKMETRKEFWARLTEEQKAELKRWRAEHRWHPHRIRHTHATEVRRQFGLEAAQVTLGHAQAQVTEVYAERDLKLATQVAAKIG